MARFTAPLTVVPAEALQHERCTLQHTRQDCAGHCNAPSRTSTRHAQDLHRVPGRLQRLPVPSARDRPRCASLQLAAFAGLMPHMLLGHCRDQRDPKLVHKESALVHESV